MSLYSCNGETKLSGLQASVNLSIEITKAIRRNNNALGSLERNSAVAAYEGKYWAAMSNGTGGNYGSMYNGLKASTLVFHNSINFKAQPLGFLEDCSAGLPLLQQSLKCPGPLGFSIYKLGTCDY